MVRKLTNNDSKVVESTEKLIEKFKSDNFVHDKIQRFGGDESRHESVGYNHVFSTIAEIKDSLFPYIKYRIFYITFRRIVSHT